MNFVESIKTCFTKYADFGGCASRPELWWWTLFTFIASMTLAIASASLSWAFTMATFLPGVAVTTRRLHDTDRSGWFQLLWLIPKVGWIVLFVWCTEEGQTNQYSGSTEERETFI